MWISSGIGLAIMLTKSWKYCPAIFLGAFVSYLYLGAPWLPALFIAINNLWVPLFGYWLLTRLRILNSPFDFVLSHASDYLLMAGVLIIPVLIATTIGQTSLWHVPAVTPATIPEALFHWSMGNMLGVLSLTPLTIVWCKIPNDWLTSRRVLESLSFFGLAFLFGQVVFMDWFKESLGAITSGYWIFLIIVLAIIRFKHYYVSLIIGMVLSESLLGAVQRIGFFTTKAAQTGVLGLWLYILVLIVFGIIVSQSIHERKKMEASLKESEARMRATLDNIPDLLFELGLDGRFHSYHCPRTELQAVQPEQMLGKLVSEVLPSDAAKIIMIALQEANETGYSNGKGFELSLPHGNKSFELSVARKQTLPNEESRFIVLSRDVTERSQAELYELFRSQTLELLVEDTPLSVVLKAIATGVEQINQSMLCSILLLDNSGKHLTVGAAPSLPDFYNAAINGIEIGMGAGSCGTAAFTGLRVIVQDIPTHPYWTAYKELAAKAGLVACWSQPIRFSSGRVLGTFAIYHREQNMPTEADIYIIEQSARLASIAIERSKAQTQLKQKERYQRALLDNFPFGVWLKDTDSHFLSANLGLARIYGLPASEKLVGKSDFDICPPDLAECYLTDDRTVLSSREKKVVEELVFTEGKRKWFETYKAPVINDDGELLGTVGFTRDISKRKANDEKLHLAASVFTHAREAIMITGPDGSIIDVNDAYTVITGYSRAEVINRNPSFLRSGKHDKQFFAAMWADLIEKQHWSGEIWNQRKNGEVFVCMQTISAVCDDQGNAKHYVALFSDITALKKHEQELEKIAHYDSLTNLPNRVLLADRLHQGMTQAIRYGQPLAVGYIDLDGFKCINDKYGHEAGDRLLMTLATHMKQALREGDTLARLGGDEFVVVLLNQISVESSLPMLSRLLAAAAQPLQTRDLLFQVSASLGVTFYPQENEVDADQLLRQADQAMYQAKLAGKNRYHIFDAAQDSKIRSYHENLWHIRQALNAREFVLFYQPKVNMRTGKVIGAEALIRWQHPEKGLLLPTVFLPLIEDHPLAIELGEWVINAAMLQMEEWHDAKLDIPVSVNIGAKQLQQIDFFDSLSKILESHPEVTPSRLELEVLETSALEDLAHISMIIKACEEIGVKFALDDFGTGYSSLTYLKRLPVNTLKIDQSFVSNMLVDPDDLIIVEGVLSLAAAFKRQVIAEGVETDEHGKLLLRLGCELAQGYGIARPMQPHLLPNWVAAWNPGTI